MTLRQTVKNHILSSSFTDSVIEVYIHLFLTNGTGYNWNAKGELVNIYGAVDAKNDTASYWESLNSTIHPRDNQITFTAHALKRRFIHDNIDAILDSFYLNDPFDDTSEKLIGYDMDPKTVNYTYGNAFNFPLTIAYDYAVGLRDFFDYWNMALNHKYMLSNNKDLEAAINHWPDEAKKLRTKIKEMQERLIDTGHFGTREERAENAERMMKLVAEVIAESK